METAIDRLRETMRRAQKFPDNWAPALLEGTITSVSDPDNLGRVKVLLDHFRAKDGSGFETDWVLPLELTLAGKLPGALVGRRCLCHTINHSYETMRVSLGTKPLVYKPEDSLPLAVIENLGLTFIRAFPRESYLCVMVVRNGQVVPEPLAPLSHLHADGDVMTQGLDSGGDVQGLIPAKPTDDNVYVTTVTPYAKNSGVLPPPSLL